MQFGRKTNYRKIFTRKSFKYNDTETFDSQVKTALRQKLRKRK